LLALAAGPVGQLPARQGRLVIGDWRRKTLPGEFIDYHARSWLVSTRQSLWTCTAVIGGRVLGRLAGTPTYRDP